MDYYRGYIAGERQKGRTEEDIFQELGEPYLIARTILDSYERTNPTVMQHTVAEEETSGSGAGDRAGGNREPGMMKKIINLAVFLLVVFLIIWIGGAVLSVVLKLLLPVLIVVFIISALRRRQ